MQMDNDVSLEQLEPHKENIQQSKRGRSAKAIVASFESTAVTTTTSATAASKTTTTAPPQHLLDAVVACAYSDDPLDAHCKLLAWYNATFPQGPPVKQYAKVLENAARAYRKDPRYANDVRFVNIWLQVAKKAPEPEDVFKYLFTNGIGLACAVYYEEYALLLELRSRFKEADKIYSQGVSRNAAPLERLKRKYEAFQHRMMFPQKKPSEEEEQEEEAIVQRPVLASSASIPHRKVPPPPPSAAPMPTSAYSSYGSMKPVSKASTSNAPTGKLAVFKDDSFSAAPVVAPTQVWSDIGTCDSQIKENTIQPEPWAGTRLPQQKATTVHQPRFDVFVDETSSKSFTAKKKDASILASSQNPDVSRSVQTLLSEKPEPTPIDRPRTPSIEPPHVESNLHLEYDFEKVYCNNREYSFEEIRAQNLPPVSAPVQPTLQASKTVSVSAENVNFMKSVKKLQHQPLFEDSNNSNNPFGNNNMMESSSSASSSPDHFDSSDEDEDAEADRELERLVRLNTCGNNTISTFGKNDEFDARSSGSLSTNSAGASFISKAKAVASPTINTKAALADVYEMFNAKLPSEQLRQQQQHHYQQKSATNRQNEVDDGDDEDEVCGDEVVAVKNGLDDKPEWYEIEADETISRKVIQPQSSGLRSAVFVDNDESVPAVKASSKMTISNDENAASENHPKRTRKPLGAKELVAVAPKPTTPVVDVQSPFFHDENNAKPQHHQSSPSIPSSSRVAAAAASTFHSESSLKPHPKNSSTTLTRALSAAPNLHSTPFHQQQQQFHQNMHHTSTLQEDEDPSYSDHEESLKNHEIQFNAHPTAPHYYRLNQLHHQKDLMTPITETSFEYDRTIGGLSTIRSIRLQYGDDFTMGSNGRVSEVTGVLRESLVGGLKIEAPDTVLPKRHVMRQVDGGSGDGSFGNGSGLSLSSISMASTSGALSSVDVSSRWLVGGSVEEDKEDEADHMLKFGLGPGSELSSKHAGAGVGKETVVCALETEPNGEEMDIPNPCNPNRTHLQEHFMTLTESPISQMNGYMNFSKLPNAPSIGNSLEQALHKAPDGGIFQTQFGPQTFVRFRVVKRLSGEGGAVKYLARELKSGMFAQSPIKDEDQELEDDDEEDQVDEEDEEEEPSSNAVKRQFILSVETPGCGWEFYALKSLRYWLPARILASIPNPVSCHIFVDSSCTRTDFCSEMTLLDAITCSSKPNLMYGLGVASPSREGGVEELLTAFWTIELLRTIESIHVSGFLHGEVTVSNILVRKDRIVTMTGGAGYWDSKYDPSGCGGWGANGVMLAVFGKAVDLFAFPVDQVFEFGESRKGKCCWEVENGVPCKYEPDWFGVANVVHWMLFGKDIQVVYEENVSGGRPKGKVVGSFKRSWQVGMWEKLFDLLVNLDKAEVMSLSLDLGSIAGKDEEFAEFAGEYPPALHIRALRLEMEQWLVGSCSTAGKSLKSLLQRVEMASLL
ncbi:UNVERIFIED_CONTAM: hypothetical protein HDU68_000676 [Siphonaria sp. JEL0065]|nr:hypothetical protein HDU68_000676 [Siphonaria sp. JEL0065]